MRMTVGSYSFLIAVMAVVFVVGAPSFSHAGVINRDVDGLTSTFYEQGSNKTKPLFKGTYSIKTNGDTVSQINTIKNLDGKTVAIEKLDETNGKFSGYSLQRINAGESGSVKIAGKALRFTYTKNGGTKSSDLEFPDSFVIGPWLTAYTRERWSDIMSGEEVHVKYGALDRRDIFRFKLFKVKEKKLDGRDVVVVKFKPGTFLVSLLVDPVLITFSKDGSKVYAVSGRTFILRNINGEFEPLNADTVYHHGAR